MSDEVASKIPYDTFNHTINVICIVPSLDIKDNNLYFKLRSLLGDSLIKDVNIRTSRMISKTAQVIFTSCQQETCQFSGIKIDMAIIADTNITDEWLNFLKYKISVFNGILLRIE